MNFLAEAIQKKNAATKYVMFLSIQSPVVASKHNEIKHIYAF